MNIDWLYLDFPDVKTDLEKVVDSDDFDGNAVILPDFFRVTRRNEPTADGFMKDQFLARQPAFGWSLLQIREIEEKAKESELNEFFLYSELSEMMRRRLICPSGAETVSALCEILRQEQETGVPSPIPSWYRFDEARFGPGTGKKRRFGYQKCENRLCFATEDTERQFARCSNCKLACYCSHKCQVVDWKARHKKVCKAAKEHHDLAEQACKMLNNMARSS